MSGFGLHGHSLTHSLTHSLGFMAAEKTGLMVPWKHRCYPSVDWSVDIMMIAVGGDGGPRVPDDGAHTEW